MDLIPYPTEFLIITVVSLLVSLFVTYLQKVLVDQNEISRLKEKQKNLQEKIKKLSPEKALKEQSKMMGYTKEMMMLSMKPMIYSFIPIMVVFWLLSSFYTGLHILELPFTIPILNETHLGWLGWYLILVLTSGILFKKLLKIA